MRNLGLVPSPGAHITRVPPEVPKALGGEPLSGRNVRFASQWNILFLLRSYVSNLNFIRQIRFNSFIELAEGLQPERDAVEAT